MEVQEIQYKSKTTKIIFTDDYFEHIKTENSVLIVDSSVYYLYHPFHIKNQIIIRVDEKNKSLKSIEEIYSKLVEFGAGRNTHIYAIGGGITCDMVGFAASTYLRGLPFSLIPTTLLAQADAAIGGKSGVNYRNVKNIIGAINQPEEVIISTSFLNSLNERLISAGFAEIIKMAFIRDTELYNMLLEFDFEEPNFLSKGFIDILKRTINNKVQIVVEDELEAGTRRILNFGHTIGHGIESAYRIQHGDAVSLGMVFAAKLSEKLGLIEKDVVKKLILLLNKFKLPTNELIEPKPVIDYLKSDKKREGSLINFVLLEGIGKSMVKKIKLELIEKAVYDLYKS